MFSGGTNVRDRDGVCVDVLLIYKIQPNTPLIVVVAYTHILRKRLRLRGATVSGRETRVTQIRKFKVQHATVWFGEEFNWKIERKREREHIFLHTHCWKSLYVCIFLLNYLQRFFLPHSLYCWYIQHSTVSYYSCNSRYYVFSTFSAVAIMLF